MSWQDPNPFAGQGGGNPFGSDSGGNPFGGTGSGHPSSGRPSSAQDSGTPSNPFGGPGQGPGFGPPGYQPMLVPGVPAPTRKRRGPALIIVAVVAVLALVGVGMAQYLRPSGAERSGIPQVGQVSPPLPSARESPTAEPTPEPSVEPTPSPTPSSTSRATVAPPPRSQVPIDPPTGPYLGSRVLADNALYGVPMGRWTCAGMDPAAPAKAEQAKVWVEKSIDCMMQRYGPAVEQAGGTLTRPKASYFTGSFTSPCGTWRNIVAYYCGGDSIIYIDYAVLARYDDNVRLGAIHLLFHEFGHHVQSRVGILSAGANAQAEDANQRQRRIELQVECFTYIQVQTWDQWTPADEPQYRNWAKQDQDALHGTGRSFTYWFERSIGQQKLGACNTWVVPKNRVA